MFVRVCNPMEKTSNLFDWFYIGYTPQFCLKICIKYKDIIKITNIDSQQEKPICAIKSQKIFPAKQNKLLIFQNVLPCSMNKLILTVLIDSAILYMTGLTSQQGSIVPATVREMNPQSSPGLMNWTQRFAIVVLYQSDHCLLSNAKHNLVLPK